MPDSTSGTKRIWTHNIEKKAVVRVPLCLVVLHTGTLLLRSNIYTTMESEIIYATKKTEKKAKSHLRTNALSRTVDSHHPALSFVCRPRRRDERLLLAAGRKLYRKRKRLLLGQGRQLSNPLRACQIQAPAPRSCPPFALRVHNLSR